MRVARYLRLVGGLVGLASLATLLSGGGLGAPRPVLGAPGVPAVLAAVPRDPAHPAAWSSRASYQDTASPVAGRTATPGARPPIAAAGGVSPPPRLHHDAPDPVVQRAAHPPGAAESTSAPGPSAGWDGLTAASSGCHCTPPDTDGAAGATQYLQAVNGAYQVWDKAAGT